MPAIWSWRPSRAPERSPAATPPSYGPFTDGARLKHNTQMMEAPLASAGPAAAAVPGAETLVFEQPLNERMRTFLRLDFLYNQALYHNEMASPWGSRAAMSSLIDILALATRGDVRSDVLKELEKELSTLNEFQTNPGVDSQRLKTLVANLGRLRSDLMNAGSAFLQPLRDSEFLSAIKHRSAIPGGTCEFDLPDYYFWLSQSDEAGCVPSASGWACCDRCAMPSRNCCGSRARTAARGRRSPRAALSASPSSGTIPCSCCGSHCRRAWVSIRKSAAATIAAACAS